MASRAFSSPRSLQMLLPILLVSVGILLVAVIKQNRELSELSGSESAMVVPAGWSTYSSSTLGFQIAVPNDADIAAAVESGTTSTRERLGRVGGISVTTGATTKPHWSISVYTNLEKAEKDFGTGSLSFTEYMKDSGLEPRITTVDGLPATLFYGVHPVDGVGGSEYDYVAAEVVGSTYTYMVQFYNMGTDPDAAAITQYLSGFDAE